MINFLLLMLIPIGIAIGTLLYFKHKVTLKEFGIQLAIPTVLMAAGLGIAYVQSTYDTEIWNGRITAKKMERVHCRHSYSCRCRTVRVGKTSSTHCDTCYEHSYDQDWNVFASTGETIRIDTVDRRGLTMPPRWGAAFVGEPFSSSHSYTNYIRANPSSVLLGGKGDVERFKALLPVYPQVYDYYKAPHALQIGGAPVPDMNAWEWLMDEINGDLGYQKQVNVTLMFVKTADPKYMLALKDSWIGGKKNDAVIVIGTLDGRKIEFVDVLSWTPNQKFKILLRDDIARLTLDDRDKIAALIRKHVSEQFVRMQMKDYEYLVRSFQPSNGAMLFLFFLGTFASIGAAIWSVTNDITDEQPSRRAHYYGYYR